MHDSELVAVEHDGNGGGCIILNAFVHRSHGEPGWMAGEGGTQRIRLAIRNIAIYGEIGSLPSYIYEGSLMIGNQLQDNIIPFPSNHAESIRFSMMLAEDARTLEIVGSDITIEPENDFQWVESFPGVTRP